LRNNRSVNEGGYYGGNKPTKGKKKPGKGPQRVELQMTTTTIDRIIYPV